MADEIWVNGEMAHKNTPKFVNEGGVPGVSAGTVDQAAFNVRNKHLAREWLFNELERQKYREMYNITFDSDDGGEKERFAAARKEYFDTYGEDFMGNDENMPWTDTYPGEAIDKPVESVEKDESSEENNEQIKQLKEENTALREELENLNTRINELMDKLNSIQKIEE